MLTSVNDPDNYTRMAYAGHPDVFVESVRMFYAYKCRLNFLETVRIRKARHVYPDEGDPDGNACHVSPWGAWHVFSGGRVPTATMSTKERCIVHLWWGFIQPHRSGKGLAYKIIIAKHGLKEQSTFIEKNGQRTKMRDLHFPLTITWL